MKTAPPPPQEAQKPAAAEPMLYCPVCSLRLEERGCKLRCRQCGYYWLARAPARLPGHGCSGAGPVRRASRW